MRLTLRPPYPKSPFPSTPSFSKDVSEGLIFGGGLYTEGFIKGGKFAFQNLLGLYSEGSFQCANDNIGALNRNSYVIYFGLFGIIRGAYFRNFTV